MINCVKKKFTLTTLIQGLSAHFTPLEQIRHKNVVPTFDTNNAVQI